MSTTNHPYNLEYLIKTLTAQLAPQPDHDRPRSEWNFDEKLDGRAKTDSIKILLVKPNEAPELITIPNELSAMQGLVGGTITVFDSGVEGTVGVAHDEAVLLQMPPNRFIPSTHALLFGPLFIAGNGVNFHSLSEQELVDALVAFTPPLTIEQVQTALRAETGGEDWIERGLREALDEQPTSAHSRVKYRESIIKSHRLPVFAF